MQLGYSLLALVTALLTSLGLGLGLGRAATQWFSGRGFSNLLMDVRGAMLSYLVGLLVLDTYHLPTWLVVGLVVGASQAVAIARWITRRSGEWTPALVGGIALGRSTSALVTRRAATRGAVTATLAMTVVHVLTLEGALHLILSPPAPENLGGLMASGAEGSWAGLGLLSAVVLIALEGLFGRLLQRHPGS